jgi:hypothetical protein
MAMAEIATPTQPRAIPNPSLTASSPAKLSLSTPSKSMGSKLLPINTALSPVTQNGSFEFDRIIKQGRVSKRTRKTKVGAICNIHHQLLNDN